jgi:hypothetical protein
MLVRSHGSSVRRNFAYGTVVQVGPPLLGRRSTPIRAWSRDVSDGPARRARKSGFSDSVLQRKKRETWREKIRSLIAELGILGHPRPSRAFG